MHNRWMPPTKPWGNGNTDPPVVTWRHKRGSIFPVPQGLLGGINRLCIQHTSVVKKPSKHVGHPILARFNENRLCFPCSRVKREHIWADCCKFSKHKNLLNIAKGGHNLSKNARGHFSKYPEDG